MDDPKETRMVQTRDGVAHVPRSQQGVPLRAYFQNTELPADLERAQVFVSATGPVVVKPDPVPWTAAHDKEAQGYADKLKVQIEEKGYYKYSLKSFADRLSDETGYPVDEMKANIVSKFEVTYGKDVYNFHKQVRAEKGLPDREREVEQAQRHEPEM